MSENTTTVYRIPSPYSMAFGSQIFVEVYGDPENAWYEWRFRNGDKVENDTGQEEHHGSMGRQYGSPEIALRDALCVITDMPDPHIEDMKDYDYSPEP